MVYKFFDKKSKISGAESVLNQQLLDQLLSTTTKPTIRKFKRTRVYSSFKKIFRVFI